MAEGAREPRRWHGNLFCGCARRGTAPLGIASAQARKERRKVVHVRSGQLATLRSAGLPCAALQVLPQCEIIIHDVMHDVVCLQVQRT